MTDKPVTIDTVDQVRQLYKNNILLRAALAKYADHDNWTHSLFDPDNNPIGYRDAWVPYSNGWELAESALASKNVTP
jgi:hypothetical protein